MLGGSLEAFEGLKRYGYPKVYTPYRKVNFDPQ